MHNVGGELLLMGILGSSAQTRPCADRRLNPATYGRRDAEKPPSGSAASRREIHPSRASLMKPRRNVRDP
jgi:hypothetical protein